MSSAPDSQTVDLSQPRSRGELVEGLRQRLGCGGSVDAAEQAAVFSCGVTVVDRLLPSGGLRRGMLLEWVAASESRRAAEQQSRRGYKQNVDYCSAALPLCCSSTMTLGLLSAREACREGGVLVVIDRWQTFYPPAAAAWGINLDRLIVVHPQNARDELWSAVQALRSPAVAAMWAAIDRLDSRAFRRLQLAAQAGRTLGVLVRPASAREQPSWADVTLGIRPLSVVPSQLHGSDGLPTTDHGRLVHVQVLRCHPGRAGGSAVLEIDDVARIVQEAGNRYQLSAPVYRPRLLADG
jgi:protein ImuA